MATGKKSFILYCDQRGIFDKLSDEQAGVLIKHIFAYVSDENPTADFITELAFESIKTALKRDLRKYENYIDKQRENGAKGGRPKKAKKPKPFSKNPTEPKKADSVSDNDSVSDSVNEFFKNEELNKAFLDFMKHRKQLKKPMTERAVELSVKKLEKETEQNAIKMIENSIENGWAGLFELKDEKKKQEHDFKNFDNVEYP
jgi:hypothetical protein